MEGFERIFIQAAVAAARSGTSDYNSSDGGSNRSPSDSNEQLSTHTVTPFTGVTRSRHTGRELRPVIGGKSYRSRGDESEDKYWKDRAGKCEEVEAAIKELEANGKDIDIECKTCKKKFRVTHIVSDQIRFKKKGWQHNPARCQECNPKTIMLRF